MRDKAVKGGEGAAEGGGAVGVRRHDGHGRVGGGARAGRVARRRGGDEERDGPEARLGRLDDPLPGSQRVHMGGESERLAG